MSEYSYTFCGIPLRVVMNEEPAEPRTYDHPGCEAVFELDEIIMPDGDRSGAEYFSESTLEWIEGEVRKKLQGEADSAQEDRAVERHYSNLEYLNSRRHLE